MKSKILTSMVVACAFALVNCDDTTSAVEDALQEQGGVPTSSSDGLAPTTTPEISSGSIVGGDNAAIPASSDSQGLSQGIEQGTVPASSAIGGGNLVPATSSAGGENASPTSAPASSGQQGGDVAPAPASSSAGTTVTPASSSAAAPASSSEAAQAPAASGVFLAEGTDENRDQMEVEYIERTGHDGGGILSYPKRLSADKKHAVVVWGPGGGTEPGAYGGMIRRLASHGFVVIALRESPGNTSQGKPALDWLEKKNKDPNDPLYQKLDMTKVGCSGHSMGGLESEQMVIQDKRVITAMLNNSGDLGHTAMASVPTDKTIGIVYGEAGMERPNAEADYNNNGVRAPACLIQMTGGPQGGEGGWGHGSGPWGGMAATVAWMRWHLGGEDFRKADFVGSSGRYINGEIIGEQGHWKGTCKNF
ncbi:MAG: alpha/beta hydrolase [Fibrobacter sp.]|nr:alpha/beta hydrolase [Fibrobacter sp.]